MSQIPDSHLTSFDAPRIALVSFDSLGDGLIYLMMASLFENSTLSGNRADGRGDG